MSDGGPTEVALALIGAINRHDADAIGELISEDHTLYDAAGRAIQGRGTVIDAWRRYFELMPDYAFRCHDAMDDGTVALLAGTASGTLASYGRRLKDQDHWRAPTAWKAVVADGLVRELHVYTDNKPVEDILDKYRKVGE